MTSLPKDVKGKGRVTETTPLLSNGGPSTSRREPSGGDEEQPAVETNTEHPSTHAPFRRTLLNVFLVSLTTVVVVFVAGVFLVYSYAQRARNVGPDQLTRAVVWKGPSSVDVLNVTEGGEVILNVTGLIGIDTDVILDFKTDDSEESFLVRWWRDIGRWGVGVLQEATVVMETARVFQTKGEVPLAKALIQPFVIPLTTSPGDPWDEKWLRPISFMINTSPSQDSTLLEQFAKETWANGFVDLHVEVDLVSVHGGRTGKKSGWRNVVEAEKRNITTTMRYKLPDMPGIPDPHPPLVKLLQLVSYSVVQDDNQLSLYALATVPNPIEKMKVSLPRVPYEVSLLDPPLVPLPISAGSVSPILTAPNISLVITGKVIPLPSPDSSIILSSFLTKFLSGIPPPIAIRSPLFPKLTIETTFPPPVPPPQILRNVTIKHMSLAVGPSGTMLASGTIFATMALPPGFHMTINVTHVLPDVLLFDGPVEVPPEEEEEFDDDLDLPKIPLPDPHLPDLPKLPLPHFPQLPPWDDKLPTPTLPGHSPHHHHDHPDDHDPPPAPPLPDPLPDRAFARIRPTEWIEATTLEDCDQALNVRYRSEVVNEDELREDKLDGEGWVKVDKVVLQREECYSLGETTGWTAIVTATVERVPLQVLPGRDKLFRSFVQKVLFSRGGATAGIKGTAGVRSQVEGLVNGDGDEPPSLELNNLPFKGSVLVGKKGL
ncbi:hypothetical protein FRC20_002244 [Serendipita sp. 405]|nr:hypothetical protein FRC20_002244 [Serendipita sp. 405]